MSTPLLRAALVRSAKRVATSSASSASSHTRSRSHSHLTHPYRSTPHGQGHPIPHQRPISSRPLFAWAAKRPEQAHDTLPIPPESDAVYPLSQSPHQDVRARGQRIQELAPCPVCLAHRQRKHAAFECPDCGFPSHCSEDHWAQDAEHAKYCDRLREANQDEHDLRSGRKITEFEFNGAPFSD